MESSLISFFYALRFDFTDIDFTNINLLVCPPFILLAGGGNET